MKKFLIVFTLLFTTLLMGQVRVTKEGYPVMPKKRIGTTLADNDTIPFFKHNGDGIMWGIDFGTFKTTVGGGNVTATSEFGALNRIIISDDTTNGVRSSPITLNPNTRELQGVGNIIPNTNQNPTLGRDSNPWLNTYSTNFFINDPTPINRNWGVETLSNGDLQISRETGMDSNSYEKLFTLSSSGIPTDSKHLATKQYVDANSSSGPTSWGGIQGTLSNQSDLQSALNDRLSLGGGTLLGNLFFANALNEIGPETSGNKSLTIGSSGRRWSNIDFNVTNNGGFRVNGNNIFHQGNDGPGSGLDADRLDGHHASHFYPASNPNGYVKRTSGEFNPILRTSSSGTYTYTVQYAEYVKMEDMFFIEIFLSGINTNGSPVGALRVDGLPFPVHSNKRNGLHIAFVNGLNRNFYQINAFAVGSNIVFNIQSGLDGSLSPLGNATFTNGNLMISGWCRTNQSSQAN